MKQFLPKALWNAQALPREDILELIECIESASSRRRLILSLKALSEPAELQLTNDPIRVENSEIEQLDPSNDVESIRKAVCRILSDKEIFPTNGELIRAIERELGIPMAKGNQIRESRDRIVKKAWREFSLLKHPALLSRTRRFIEKFGPSQDDYYKTLFDILSRRE